MVNRRQSVCISDRLGGHSEVILRRKGQVRIDGAVM